MQLLAELRRQLRRGELKFLFHCLVWLSLMDLPRVGERVPLMMKKSVNGKRSKCGERPAKSGFEIGTRMLRKVENCGDGSRSRTAIRSDEHADRRSIRPESIDRRSPNEKKRPDSLYEPGRRSGAWVRLSPPRQGAERDFPQHYSCHRRPQTRPDRPARVS